MTRTPRRSGPTAHAMPLRRGVGGPAPLGGFRLGGLVGFLGGGAGIVGAAPPAEDGGGLVQLFVQF